MNMPAVALLVFAAFYSAKYIVVVRAGAWGAGLSLIQSRINSYSGSTGHNGEACCIQLWSVQSPADVLAIGVPIGVYAEC